MAQSMFERNGGFARVRRIVADFYEKATESPVLGHYFEGIDMARLIDHQTKFVAGLMGGPASLNDEALRRAHARLGISRAEFAEMAALLCDALAEHDVPDGDVEEVRRLMQQKEPLIVAPGGPGA